MIKVSPEEFDVLSGLNEASKPSNVKLNGSEVISIYDLIIEVDKNKWKIYNLEKLKNKLKLYGVSQETFISIDKEIERLRAESQS